jgi:hypothetical protein
MGSSRWRQGGYQEPQGGWERGYGEESGGFGNQEGRYGQEGRFGQGGGYGRNPQGRSFESGGWGQSGGWGHQQDDYGQESRFNQGFGQERGYGQQFNRSPFGQNRGMGQESRWGGTGMERGGTWQSEHQRGNQQWGGTQQGRQGMTGTFAGRGPQGYRRSDERILEDVYEALTQDPDVDATMITAEVKNGEVTLKGTVPDRNAKRMAEEIAENCSGVKDVQNQLRVKRENESETESRQDDTKRSGGKQSAA